MNYVICPVRNGIKYTRKSVPDMLGQDIGDVEVLLIDNGSSDGTADWARAWTDRGVRHLRFAEPRSVARSWNIGLTWVFSQGCDYALVVNNDVRLRPDTYRLLVADGGEFVTGVGEQDRGCLETGVEPASRRPHPDFSCYVIRKSVWDKVGQFNEECAVAYTEDSDYHIRMHRAGVEARCIGVPFWHEGAGTIKQASRTEADIIRLAADENRRKFAELYGFEVGSEEYYLAFGQRGGPASDQTTGLL
jgi:GT2 family glycosyltransferase